MKSVVISIQPKWVGKIASGKKTIEVRKTRPKLETPFKVYIYETKAYDSLFGKGKPLKLCVGGGKVIGEFVCDRVDLYYYTELIGSNSYDDGYVVGDGNTCLSYEEFMKYGKGKDLYGWHISDLKIYDEPKELSEFIKYMDCKNTYDCCVCHNWDRLNLKCIAMNNEVKRPPQSWCYVEENEDED